MRRGERAQKLRHYLLGVILFALVFAFVGGTVAIYDKAFVEVVTVRVETDRVGNQMRVGSEVKLRDVTVGEVAAVRTTGDGAVLELALRPELVNRIPSTVSARLKPKTLFGERVVSLEETGAPGAPPLAAGSVIPQHRAENTTETDKVLDDLLPVLRAVQPQKLSATLSSIASTLDGRGERIGETAVALDAYLRELNPSLPALTDGLDRLADVTELYDRAAPDLIGALNDLRPLSKTLEIRRDDLAEALRTGTAASDELALFLAENRANLLAFVIGARPTLELLAEYSPQVPCLLRQFADLVPKAEAFVGKGTDHPGIAAFTAEITVHRGPYLPGVDDPVIGERRGPRCYPTPAAGESPPQYPPGGPFEDGSEHPPAGDGPLGRREGPR